MLPKQQKKLYPIGSLSSGTMRPEDLIPDFKAELESLVRTATYVPVKTRNEHRSLCEGIMCRMSHDCYWESEDVQEDLEALEDALEVYAAPYFYFGTSAGDASDYGFWLRECWQEDFDGLTVSDLSEVPASYRGEVMLVNDHGNMTLYAKTARGTRVIWEVV